MSTPVSTHGDLRMKGVGLVDQHDRPVVLRGMSLFWSQMGARFYNPGCIRWLVRDWNCSVIRAAMGIELGGYLENPGAETDRVLTAIEACIQEGIYIIVDWHDHRAQDHADHAFAFFDLVSRRFGKIPNLIYEIYNEPLDVSWSGVIKPYADSVISAIRNNRSPNLVVVGTPRWSQDVDEVIADPLKDSNVAYALHFYSGTQHQSYRDKAQKALDHGVPLFVSEYGLSEANGNGPLGLEDGENWYRFMNRHRLSRCAWSVSDMKESSAALFPTASSTGGWKDEDLTPCGRALRTELRGPSPV